VLRSGRGGTRRRRCRPCRDSECYRGNTVVAGSRRRQLLASLTWGRGQEREDVVLS
jgi:hypothetical protein